MDEKDRSRERSRRERPSRFSEASRDRSTDRGRDRGSQKSSNNRVYVSNIPYEYRWQDMKDLFRSQVGDVQFVELFVDDNDKPKGCGIVEFSDSSCVKKCLEVMQRYEVKGRKLVVREDSGNVRDKQGNIVGSSNKRSRDDSRYRSGGDDRGDRYDSLGGVGGGVSLPLRQDESKWGNTYGLSPHFLESLNIDAPLCNRVFVANLEYNIEKKKLKEVFRLAGKVQKVEIPLDKDGRSRGFAVVEFDHPVEAVQAISMLHNQVLFDRPMTVRMDRANDAMKLPEGLKTIGMGLGTNGEPLKNVAHNLPSNSNNNQGSGAGILGAVPNPALQMANALTGLNSVVGSASFDNFGSNQSVLQANLGGLASNLLGSGLNGTDLSLTSNQVSSLLAQNPSQQLASLTGSGTGNIPSLTGGSSGNLGNFGRNDNNYSSGQGYNSGSRNFQSSGYDSQKSSSGYGGGYGGNDNNVGGGGGYGTGGGNSMLRSPVQNDGKSGGFSRKVLITNLPPSASYKMMHDKLNEFGDVKYLEEKGQGGMLVIYASEWQAERAYKNLDRARIDGRVIDARLYY